jgi:DNA-binding response OmpR family regulator
MNFLVIDDEPLVRRSLARALRARGYSSVEAEDGESGLAAWEEQAPDAVIIDVLMPGLSGPDVVRRAVAAAAKGRHKTPVIALISAFSGEDSEKLATECGADCFVAKPFDDIFAVVDLIAAKVIDRRSKESR